jgi:hypothetical protein
VGLIGKPYTLSSGSTKRYNCVAYANGEIHRPWSPVEPYYWPEEFLRSPYPSVESFCGYLEERGFCRCDDSSPHASVERIAIYGDALGCLHMARQLGGEWLSKMGDAGDIEHADLTWIESAMCGTVQAILCRHFHPALAEQHERDLIRPGTSIRRARCGFVVELAP